MLFVSCRNSFHRPKRTGAAFPECDKAKATRLMNEAAMRRSVYTSCHLNIRDAKLLRRSVSGTVCGTATVYAQNGRRFRDDESLSADTI